MSQDKNLIRELYPLRMGFFDEAEYREDMQRIVVIKRMIRRYLDLGTMNARVISNYFITISNTFDENTEQLFNLVLDYRELVVAYSFLKFLQVCDPKEYDPKAHEILIEMLESEL